MKSSSPHARNAALTALAVFASAAAAAPQASGSVFTCTTAKGQHLRSDRPIAECMDREQRVLGRDGSLLRIVPPTLTLEERAVKEAHDRRAAAERTARKEAERADRLLLQRYPDEPSHSKAREAALDNVRASLKQSEQRIRALAAERKPLDDEAEFYRDRPLPAKLRQQYDAVDAATEAQRSLVSNQEAEIGRVNAIYDLELARLKKLWAGTAPGSLGPINTSAQLASTPRAELTQKK